ncbi:MAG: polyprenol monophosphomannose synthase [Ignavibacteria bacterium]|jgi:dolichol-phosphate mannosyltransferase|nr:polyprenol monophosphomannose synthase [Ignavibacteria bacterium]MDH7527405.1 polyprenol monophosphomannose synthase [Ignavibacteria bacterium]
MNKAIVIIPTYNESENIKKLIPEILKRTNGEIDILIVDDNSPDGTSDVVRNFQKEHQNIFLMTRPKKAGLGTAYVEGFKFALSKGYEYILQMDADFSHEPKEIKNFLKRIQECDLVIGSRYKDGVRVLNWPLSRLFLSVFANLYTMIITGMPVKDATGGYKCFRRKVLEAIDLDKIRSNGYAFQIEMNFKAYRKGFKICEMPIVFTDRVKGKSKMSKKIVIEAAWMVWKLRIQSLIGMLR